MVINKGSSKQVLWKKEKRMVQFGYNATRNNNNKKYYTHPFFKKEKPADIYI